MVSDIWFIILLFCICTIVEAKGAKCNAGWENHGHKCYKLIYPPGPGAATEHIKLCRQTFGEGVNGLQISSQEENDWVVDFAKKLMKADGKYEAPKTARIITGGLRPPGGELKWDKGGRNETGCPLNFTNWGPGEPTGNGPSVGVYLDENVTDYTGWGSDFLGKWDDFTANSSEFPVMCEKIAKDSKFDPGTCSYVEDCVNIKRSTLMTILESCACSKN